MDSPPPYPASRDFQFLLPAQQQIMLPYKQHPTELCNQLDHWLLPKSQSTSYDSTSGWSISWVDGIDVVALQHSHVGDMEGVLSPHV